MNFKRKNIIYRTIMPLDQLIELKHIENYLNL